MIDDKGQKLVIWGKVTKVGSYVTGDWKTIRDLIEVLKIFKGFDSIKYSQFFSMSDTGLRGHKLKIYKP